MNETVTIIIKIVALILLLIGVIFIFDARSLSSKWFSFGDRNEGAKTLKIVGFVVAIIGGLIAIVV